MGDRASGEVFGSAARERAEKEFSLDLHNERLLGLDSELLAS